MIRARFNFTIEDDTGVRGLRMIGRPAFEAARGNGVAHDMLEHRPGDAGTIVDEFMALGALIYVRDQGAYWHNRRAFTTAPDYHIAVAVPELVRIYYHDQCPLGHVSRRSTPIDEESVEEIIQKSYATGLSRCSGELDSEDMQQAAAEVMPLLVPAMRAGYRAALRRFKNRAGYRMNELFEAIERTVDEFIDHYDDYLGHDVEVVVDLDTYEVAVTFVDKEIAALVD